MITSFITAKESIFRPNQLLSFEDTAGITSFSYDGNGNTIFELRPNGDRVTYSWNIEGWLTKLELPDGTITTYCLDGDGFRRKIEDTAGIRKLVWDGMNLLAEADNADNTIVAYTVAPEGYGSLISQQGSGGSYFHHFDGTGSTRQLTDANLASQAEYSYRAFGEQNTLSGSSANAFGWSGKYSCYHFNSNPDGYWFSNSIVNSATGRTLNQQSVDSYAMAGDYLSIAVFAMAGGGKYPPPPPSQPPPTSSQGGGPLRGVLYWHGKWHWVFSKRRWFPPHWDVEGWFEGKWREFRTWKSPKGPRRWSLKGGLLITMPTWMGEHPEWFKNPEQRKCAENQTA